MKKINRNSFFAASANPPTENDEDTSTTEATEPIEVDGDVSHDAETENKHEKEQRKFQSRWASLYNTWLTYDREKNKMFCTKCISIGANNTMTVGCDNFKTSTLTRHAASSDHLKAIMAKTERKNLSASVNRVCTKEERAIVAALKTIYFLAQEGIALSKYTNTD